LAHFGVGHLPSDFSDEMLFFIFFAEKNCHSWRQKRCVLCLGDSVAIIGIVTGVVILIVIVIIIVGIIVVVVTRRGGASSARFFIQLSFSSINTHVSLFCADNNYLYRVAQKVSHYQIVKNGIKSY